MVIKQTWHFDIMIPGLATDLYLNTALEQAAETEAARQAGQVAAAGKGGRIDA